MLAAGDLDQILLDHVSIFGYHQSQVMLTLQVTSGTAGVHLHPTVDITYYAVQSNVDAGWCISE